MILLKRPIISILSDGDDIIHFDFRFSLSSSSTSLVPQAYQLGLYCQKLPLSNDGINI
jgi:hypothetical protein